MRLPDKSSWSFLALLGVAAACGGVSHEDFYEGPPAKRASSGGTGGSIGMGGGVANGGSLSLGGTAAGGTPSDGGSAVGIGGTGNTANGGGGDAPAMGGSGDAPATGGTGNEPSTGGTGDATSTGGSTSGGDAGTGNTANTGSGGTTPAAGMGGDGAGGSNAGQPPIGGDGNVGGAGASNGGMGGIAGMSGSASGGRGGRSSTDCDKRLSDVADRLAAAQKCSLAMDATSCTGFVENECGCKVPVNNASSSATKAYLTAVDNALSCVACTDQACPNANNAYCKRSGDGLDGVCTATSFTTF